MDIHFHYDALEAADIISRAVAAGSSITQQEIAIEYLIDASRSFETAPDVLLLVLQHLPRLTADWEEYFEEANNAVWDVVDAGNEMIRMAGYHAAAQVAALTRSTALMRINMDLLVQLLMQVTSTSTSFAEASAMKSALTAMLSVDPLAYIEVIIDNINDFDGADSEERRAAVWDFVLTDLRNALMELFMQPNAATVERTFIDGVQKSLSSETNPSIRLEVFHLLLALPGLTGATSTAEDATWLLRQIIQHSLLVGDSAATIPYLDLMDELEKTAVYKPDVRWYLYMFCKHPVTTMEWAHKGYILEAGASPSRLVDWLLAGWTLWQQEQRNGPEAVAATPSELRFTTLGVQTAKITLRQIPMIVPAGVSLSSIKRQMESLEVHLIIVYFIFVKFRGKIDSLHSDETKQRTVDIANAAEQGLAEAKTTEKGNISVRRWENVATMSKNLVDGTAFTTVVPSWKPLPVTTLKMQDHSTLAQRGLSGALPHQTQAPGPPIPSQDGRLTISNVPSGPGSQLNTFTSRQTTAVSSIPADVGLYVHSQQLGSVAGRATTFRPGHTPVTPAQPPLRLPPRQAGFKPPAPRPSSVNLSSAPMSLSIKGSAAVQARTRTLSPGQLLAPLSSAKRSRESEEPSTVNGNGKRHRSATDSSSQTHDHPATSRPSYSRTHLNRLTDRPGPISLPRRIEIGEKIDDVKRKGRGFDKTEDNDNNDLLSSAPADRIPKALALRLVPVPPTSPFTSHQHHP